MKKQILLADDDVSARTMVGRALESSGYAVTLADNDPDAVSRLDTAGPDLLLLDLKTPDEEGWKTFEQISQIHAVPTIAITTWPDQHEPAAHRGIDTVMEKPLDLPLLLETIQNLLACRLKVGESAD